MMAVTFNLRFLRVVIMVPFYYPTRTETPAFSPFFSSNSRLVLGTAALGGVWGPVDEDASIETILQALSLGIAVLDTAPAYSRAEEFVGKALQQWQGEKPFISTKIGRLKSDKADVGVYDYTRDGMFQSLYNSLTKLGVSQVDLIFLHDMESCPLLLREQAMKCMVDMKEQGLTKRIGLGGKMDNGWYHAITQNIFDVVMNYNRLNACNADALLFDIPLYKKHNIAYYNGSLLHMGVLGSRYASALQTQPPWVSNKDLQNAKRMKAIADKQGLPLATLAHRFAFTVAEADRVVIGAKNQQQLAATWADWQQGPLPEALFNDVLVNLL